MRTFTGERVTPVYLNVTQITEIRGIESSVALFGQTIFTIVSEERVAEAAGALTGFGGTLIVCNIDMTGARVL